MNNIQKNRNMLTRFFIGSHLRYKNRLKTYHNKSLLSMEFSPLNNCQIRKLSKIKPFQELSAITQLPKSAICMPTLAAIENFAKKRGLKNLNSLNPTPRSRNKPGEVTHSATAKAVVLRLGG
jgi:hypothetical protein